MLTAMGGLLARHDDGWKWRDGRPEARVRDLTAAEAYQFPRVTEVVPDTPTGRLCYVQIPLNLVPDEPDLVDVIALAGDRALRLDGESVVHVPQDVWDPWVFDRVIGVVWDPDDEEELMATAEAYGLRGMR